MKGRFFLIFLIVFVSQVGLAGKIKNAFEALEVYNYFKAKSLFESALKKESVVANYGLSIIYQREDNPFTNIDSAYNCITRAFKNYPLLQIKHKEKYALLGMDSLAIVAQRELISGDLFVRAKSVGTVEAFQQFISNNFWSNKINAAVHLRDSLAYVAATVRGTSEAYMSFVNEYPTSHLAADANSNYEKTLYLESTASNTLTAYVDFVARYPESPYRIDAEDQVFEIYTKTGSFESYKLFIQDFPENRNINEAWRKLYNTHMQRSIYSSGSIQEFSESFPNYPYKEELEYEMKLANTLLYPIRYEKLWGFIDEKGNVIIAPKFEDAEEYSEGLAVVKIKGKYGYTDKTGKLIISSDYDEAFPFHEGHAIVELKDKLGMINRNGEFIIPPRYEDLGRLEGGFTYFLLDSLYGYFDSKGIERIKPKYTDANNFEGGRAIISINGYYGLIDAFGTTYIPMMYEELRNFNQNIYAAVSNDYWGLISTNGDTLLPFEYDYIGKIFNNRAIVEKDYTFNYIDKNGKLLLTTWIPVFAEFKQIAAFKKPYAKIKLDGKYNLIDTSGNKMLAISRENIGEYSHLIAVQKAGKWGYCNTAGVLQIQYNYSSALSFNGDYAIVGVDPFFGVLNKTGAYAVQPFYEELTFINDSLLLAKSMGNFGIITTKGDTLLKFEYISIEPINEKVVRIEKGGNLYYYDLSRKQFLRKEEN